MSQKHTTVCDNCGAESEDPQGQRWSRVNVHPADRTMPDAAADDPDDRWIVRDLCPKCGTKVRAWLLGELVAVFRKPRGISGPIDAHDNSIVEGEG